MLFQDDVARLSLDVASAQRGNDRMQNVAETKLLNFNISKSCYTIFGSKRRRLEMEKDIELCPLKLCGEKMVYESSIKYLGDILSNQGLTESAESTINARKGLASKVI